MLKNFFRTRALPLPIDAALLFIRLVTGIAFVLHGTGKIQNPFTWGGEDSKIPAVFLLLAAVSEFGGGLALIGGLLTRLAACGLICTMAVAVAFHVTGGDPFVSSGGGHSYEPALNYLTIACLLLAAGPGRFSLDRKLFG